MLAGIGRVAVMLVHEVALRFWEERKAAKKMGRKWSKVGTLVSSERRLDRWRTWTELVHAPRIGEKAKRNDRKRAHRMTAAVILQRFGSNSHTVRKGSFGM